MVYAKFTHSYNNVTTNKVTQWDYGRTLRIEGLKLPTAIRIDFCISGDQNTISRIGITKDGVTDVVIPDSLLEQSQDIVAYVYLNDTTTGKTVRTINIPVVSRPKPEEYDTPEGKELFAEAIELINDVAVSVEESKSTAKTHADSAKESLESTIKAKNETAKVIQDEGAGQVKAIQDEGATQLEQIQKAGENIVEAAGIAEQNAKNVLANAIRGHLKGEVVVADDVSGVEHEMVVKVKSKNMFNIPDIETGTPTGVISCNITKPIIVSAINEAVVSKEIWRIRFTYKDGNSLYVMDRNNPVQSVFNATEHNPIVSIMYRSDNITSGQYKNIQLEEGNTATEYTPYIDPTMVTVSAGGKTYIPEADGTVKGISSTVLVDAISTDTEGVVIECEYNIDTKTYIDRKFAELLTK